ncbi:MAG: hypothetical protein R6W82_11700 [bacterium]
MKVRIHSGELRLRLLPEELDLVAEGGTVEERIRLAEGPGGSVAFAVRGAAPDPSAGRSAPLGLVWEEGRALVRVDPDHLQPVRDEEDVERAAVLSYDGEELTLVIERDLKPGRSRRPPGADG